MVAPNFNAVIMLSWRQNESERYIKLLAKQTDHGTCLVIFHMDAEFLNLSVYYSEWTIVN